MDIRCTPNALSNFSKCFLSQEISLESKSVKYEIHKSLNHCVNEIISQLMCTNSESISQTHTFPEAQEMLHCISVSERSKAYGAYFLPLFETPSISPACTFQHHQILLISLLMSALLLSLIYPEAVGRHLYETTEKSPQQWFERNMTMSAVITL